MLTGHGPAGAGLTNLSDQSVLLVAQSKSGQFFGL